MTKDLMRKKASKAKTRRVTTTIRFVLDRQRGEMAIGTLDSGEVSGDWLEVSSSINWGSSRLRFDRLAEHYNPIYTSHETVENKKSSGHRDQSFLTICLGGWAIGEVREIRDDRDDLLFHRCERSHWP